MVRKTNNLHQKNASPTKGRMYRILESIESAIEMTSYGILTLVRLGGPHFLAAASDAMRWVIQYQNENGGFISSQVNVIPHFTIF